MQAKVLTIGALLCIQGCAPAHRQGIPKVEPGTIAAAPTARLDGMRLIPAGTFRMGSNYPQFADARPVHVVHLDAYYIDSTPVTNAQFARFIAATGYVTVAEQRPDPAQFPGVPADKLVPGSLVFTPPTHPVPLNDISQWWSYVPGADWKHPTGPGSTIQGKDGYPVVQVCYQDAEAFAKWAGKRLPTEAEYEYAARGGMEQKLYAWGDAFRPNGKWMANTFQGHFPDKNTAEDGYAGASPVKQFPANGYGLYDMAGNVWEWCSDWYRADYFEHSPADNPQGPVDCFDPDEPGSKKRVQKGGSFLCTDQYCCRFMVGGRGKGAIDTGASHTGFRCVVNARAAQPISGSKQ